MLPGIGGIAGRAGGAFINRYMISRTSTGVTTLPGATVPASYSAIEFIVESYLGGRAISRWTAGQSGAPTPGSSLSLRVETSPYVDYPTYSSLSGSPSISLVAHGVSSSSGTGASGGNVSNETSAGEAHRVTVNYIP